MSITKDCMVVNLQVSTWLGYRHDKEASLEVARTNGAVDDAARVNKHLIDKAALKPIITAAGAIRTHFYSKTLPWKDNGDRLLTRKIYTKFIEEHQRLAGNFDEAVNHFLRKTYPAARDQAEFRMGDLFKADDYPSARELKAKFSVNIDIDPVSEAHDFRVKLEGDQVAEIRQGIEEAMQQRVTRAMGSIWERLATTLGHFQQKMAKDDIFRDSTVKNLEELVDLLPELNFLNDPQLEEIRKDIKNSLIGVEPKELRENKKVRKAAASEAKRIMEEMSGFMNAFGGGK